jgi:Flp pilus assembly protein TadB
VKRNPFRREGDAFHLLLVVGVAALAVIAVSLINARAGGIAGIVLIVAAIVVVWRWTAHAIGSDEKIGSDEE